MQTRTATMNSIHSGASTQIQDQLILLSNFNTIKTIVSNPQNPIPPVTVVFVSLFLIYSSASNMVGTLFKIISLTSEGVHLIVSPH